MVGEDFATIARTWFMWMLVGLTALYLDYYRRYSGKKYFDRYVFEVSPRYKSFA